MSKIDDLIEYIEDTAWDDQRTRSAVDLSDVKHWAKLVLQAVKEDLESSGGDR